MTKTKKRKKNSQRRHISRAVVTPRFSMSESEEWRISNMGGGGWFSAKGIARRVWGRNDINYDPTNAEKSRIYRTLKKRGISLRDGRDGITSEARSILRQLDGIAAEIRPQKRIPKLRIVQA